LRRFDGDVPISEFVPALIPVIGGYPLAT